MFGAFSLEFTYVSKENRPSYHYLMIKPFDLVTYRHPGRLSFLKCFVLLVMTPFRKPV